MKAAKSFAIHTLGCKVNTYESNLIAEGLRAEGLTEVDFSARADVYIINTCTVTNIADRKSRQMLHRARKLNASALVVAMGCYVDAARQNEEMRKLLEDRAVDLFISNKEKGSLIPLLMKRLCPVADPEKSGCLVDAAELCRITITDAGEPDSMKEAASEAAEGEAAFLTELDGHTRAFLKVQDGCRQFCTYCIIPYVRGAIRTRPIAEVVREVEALAARGVTEIVLNGIHLSSYGKDLHEKRAGKKTQAADDIMSGADAPLLDLIDAVSGVEGIRRIRLGSLEPRLMTEEFTKRLAGNGKVCPQFHLSLQSGCDATLRRMNRHYTTEDYRKSCERLRRCFDNPAITTDVIVGFPGETEEEFEETKRFMQEIGFYEAHIFKYSRRAGTVADRMQGQIPDPVKTKRSDELLQLSDELSHAYRKELLGKELCFLAEQEIIIDGARYLTGVTPAYVRCIKQENELKPGAYVSGTATEIIKKKMLDESLVLR